MELLILKPRIFRKLPEIKTYFVVGAFNFNLSPRSLVIRERKRLLEILGAEARHVAVISQIHSRKLIYITNRSNINFFSSKPPESDGFYTDNPAIFLGVRTADCLPILFYNRSAGVVGAVHSGWQGTKKEIIKQVVETVCRRFRSRLRDFYFYLGPAAQKCCYEVSKYKAEPLFMHFFAKFLHARQNKLFLDFAQANIDQLKQIGIEDKQIENSGICTIHNLQYPSYRREGETRRRTLLSLIGRGTKGSD